MSVLSAPSSRTIRTDERDEKDQAENPAESPRRNLTAGRIPAGDVEALY